MENTAHKLVVSMSNSKIGNIPNLSMTPGVTCAKDVPCWRPEKEGGKRKKCYADKSHSQYPNVRNAWDGNLAYWKADSNGFESDLIDVLVKKNMNKILPHFRWFVGGDIPDGGFLLMMAKIARMFPNTKFLSFTKQYTLVNNYVYCFCDDTKDKMPDNLQIVFSAWPNFPMKNRYEFPVAWLSDDADVDERLNDVGLYHSCPGSCKTCKFCWSPTDDIVFEKH